MPPHSCHIFPSWPIHPLDNLSLDYRPLLVFCSCRVLFPLGVACGRGLPDTDPDYLVNRGDTYQRSIRRIGPVQAKAQVQTLKAHVGVVGVINMVPQPVQAIGPGQANFFHNLVDGLLNLRLMPHGMINDFRATLRPAVVGLPGVALVENQDRSFKIVSGGQTGVDRAALDAALSLGIPCGG
jgi:hypothetical protein